MKYMRPVVKCDKVTMEIVERFPSTVEADKSLGLKHAYVAPTCRMRKVSKGKYVWRYESDYDPEESFAGKHNRPVSVFDTHTGEERTYYDAREAADAEFVGYWYFHQALEKHRTIYGRYAISYAR